MCVLQVFPPRLLFGNEVKKSTQQGHRTMFSCQENKAAAKTISLGPEYLGCSSGQVL